jgi:hypothetical protein
MVRKEELTDEERKFRAIEAREKKFMSLPRRRELIDHLQDIYTNLDPDTPPEMRLQYLGSLCVIEDPRATVAAIQTATNKIGEVVGLFKQRIDITARREEMRTEDELAELIATLPEETRTKIVGAAGQGLLEVNNGDS